MPEPFGRRQPASLDPDAKRQVAEERVRAVCDLLAAELIALVALTPAPQPPIELLSVEEAARRLGGIARSTLYQLMGTGAVASVKVGGRVFVSSTEIERIATGRSRHPGRGAS